LKDVGPDRPIRLSATVESESEWDLDKITKSFHKIREVVESPNNRSVIMAKMNEWRKTRITEQADELLNDDEDRHTLADQMATNKEAMEALLANEEALKAIAANKKAVRAICAMAGIKMPQSSEAE
jgi:hypothetical protein